MHFHAYSQVHITSDYLGTYLGTWYLDMYFVPIVSTFHIGLAIRLFL